VLAGVFVTPVVWFHENVVEKFRGAEYPYYHRRYRRVPTIDECYFHDHACQYEAEKQLMRDKVVETQLINLLRERSEDCMYYETYLPKEVHDPTTKCGELKRDYEIAQANFYIKYGDMKFPATAQNVLMKQKHRLIWERRNGPLPTSPDFNLD
jgi:NADH dehydrogenase (ubiquinone) 1 beta subcomplex subunit 10